jgi:hypothetical protein
LKVEDINYGINSLLSSTRRRAEEQVEIFVSTGEDY